MYLGCTAPRTNWRLHTLWQTYFAAINLHSCSSPPSHSCLCIYFQFMLIEASVRPLETLFVVVDVKPPPSLYSLINSLFDTVLKKLSGMPRLSVAGVDMFVGTSDLLQNHHWVTLFQINDQYEIVPKYFIVTEVFACYLLVSDILQSCWKRWKKRYLLPNFWRLKFSRFTPNTWFLGCFLS